MKLVRHTILVAVGFFSVAGCDNVLNQEPTNIISSAQVWEDPALADNYLNDIYDNMEFIDGYGYYSFYQVVDDAMGGELRTYGAWQAPYEMAMRILDDNGSYDQDYWKYFNIRQANDFIEQIKMSDFEDDYIQQRVAEARFLRAFMYFEMVKRFGGVPIITKTQSIDADEGELFVERDSEQAVYDFIAAEMDTISQDLPKGGYYATESVGRATKWSALALKSRAMLYAASVGEFDDMKLDGLLGIPDNEVQTYWQQAYDASKEIIDNSPHTLYDNNSDKVENFRSLFIDESSSNSEVIFGEQFDGDKKGHSFNRQAIPDGFAASWGSNYNIIYDIVELFEFEDGSTGEIDRSVLTSQEWSAEELFGSRDPRFRASVFYPETPYQGEQVYFHSSTIVNGEQLTSGTVGDDEWPAMAPNRNTTRTGFHMRKRLDENDTDLTQDGKDDTDHIEFRMGEIYLNLAEAAFYLGETGEALDALNEIRERAGMPDKGQITQDIIRNERQVELAFEGHRYWDLRRWRIAEEILDGVRMQGLRYDFNWDTQKYQVSLRNAEGQARVFQERHYYLPLGIERLADNPNFVENPGY